MKSYISAAVIFAALLVTVPAAPLAVSELRHTSAAEPTAAVYKSENSEKETKKQMLHMQEFPDMKDIYIMMIQNKFCNQQITKAVREVMTTENGSVLWHCTEGKDRCGLLSAIILFLLDVSEEDVMEDYLKTNKAAIRRVEKIRKKLHVAGFHQEKIEKLEGYFVAKEEFLNAALKTMKEDHGSINQFIKNGLHISMKEKQQFKDKILE